MFINYICDALSVLYNMYRTDVATYNTHFYICYTGVYLTSVPHVSKCICRIIGVILFICNKPAIYNLSCMQYAHFLIEINHIFTQQVCSNLMFIPRNILFSELKKSSQCANSKGHPFIKLYCNHRHLIKVHRAFHGRHLRNVFDCSMLWDDCQEDEMSSFIYDWPDCMGRQSCVQSVKQSWMPSCGNYSNYLEVHYSCLPGMEYSYKNIS